MRDEGRKGELSNRCSILDPRCSIIVRRQKREQSAIGRSASGGKTKDRRNERRKTKDDLLDKRI